MISIIRGDSSSMISYADIIVVSITISKEKVNIHIGMGNRSNLFYL